MITPLVDPVPRTKHDYRLVPAACTVWSAGLLGLLWGWWAAVTCGLLAVVGGLLALRSSLRAGVLSRCAGAVVTVVCGALVIAPLSVQLRSAELDPLGHDAAAGAHAMLRARVTERPRPIRAAGYAGHAAEARSVLVRVTAEDAQVAGREVDTTGAVLVIGPVDGWSGVLPGQVVTVRGELAPANAAELTAAVLYARGPPADLGQPPWWQRVAGVLRADLHRAASVLPEQPAGLLPGLVVGDTSALPARVEQQFTDSGLSHLTAVSGTNITIICGAVLLVLTAARVGPRLRAMLAGLALCGFVIVVGPEPSVLRAGVMGGVGLLALALGRNRSALPALAASVTILILYDPNMATSFGFALSVVATAGLVLLAPRWSEFLARRGFPKGIADAITVPLAAFVATAPIIAGMAGTLSLVSVLANICAAPAVAPVTVLGVVAMLLGPIWMDAAQLLTRCAGIGTEWLILVARTASGLPGAVVPWPAGWWGGLLAAVVCGLLIVAVRRRLTRLVLIAAVLGIVAALIPLRVVAPPWPPEGWAIVACDVGQGDALILATAEAGRAVVIDTGPDPGRLDRCLDRLDVTRVPLVVLTHLHADHIGGLASVFAGRAVGGVALGPGREPAWAWRQVADAAAAHHTRLLEMRPGDRIGWPGLRLDVLGPSYVPAPTGGEVEGSIVNNASVVLRATTAAGTILLTGDVEAEAQADLLATGVDLRADILKVPHHGSGVFLPEFFAAVDARLAVISVGADNSYGHPSARTVRALRRGGALVVCTDRAGATAVLPGGAGPVVVRRSGARAPPDV